MTRQRHTNNGPRLNSRGMRVAKGLTEVVGHLERVVTRLRGMEKQFPEVASKAVVWRWRAMNSIREAKADMPESSCLYCLGKGTKARCEKCRGTRWMTKAELAGAPEELRRKVGL